MNHTKKSRDSEAVILGETGETDSQSQHSVNK